MTYEEKKDLAKAAANAALVTQRGLKAEYAVEYFLKAYEYAMKKLDEKELQVQEIPDSSIEGTRFENISEGIAEFKHGRRL